MPKYGSQINTQRIPILGLIAEQNASAPSSPVEGLMWHDTANKLVKIWLNGAWMTVGAAGAGGPPSGTASGDLTGNYPGPTIAANVVTAAKIANATITDTQVAGANKDGTTVTPSLRTLGTGALQAAAGNDSRFSDSRAPTGAASGDLTGNYPGPTINALAVTAAKMALATITDAQVATANKDGAVGTASLRTIGTGAQQAMAGNTTMATMPTPNGSVSFNDQRQVNVADPINPQDGATRFFVEQLVQGLDPKPSVRVATTANVVSLSGLPTIDTVTVVAGDRVLIKDQSTASQNGIYVASAGAWSRAADMNSWLEVPSAYVFVEEGSANIDSGWTCTANQGGTIDSTAMTWTQFSGAGSVVAGTGLTKTGNTLDVIGTANRITVAADSVDISTAYVGQATITTLGTITAGTWNGTDVAVADGGTGAGTAAGARTNLGVPAVVTGTLPALSAGTWSGAIAHGLSASQAATISFNEVGSPYQEIVLDWRFDGSTPTTSFNVRADVAYGAGALAYCVTGK